MRNIDEWEIIIRNATINDVRYIVDNIPDHGILFDIGANTGVLSQEVLKQKPNIALYLFEPVKEYFDLFPQKFFDKNVNAYNFALSDKTEQVKISCDPNNKGWNTLSSIQEYGIQIDIQTVTLSELIDKDNLPIPDIMKIDVEESECMVIDGYKKAMDNGHLPGIIYMEILMKKNNPLWNKRVEMMEYLFKIGYERFDYNSINNTVNAVFKLKK